MPNHPSSVQLLTFDVRQHLPMLRIWLERPHVARWWGDADEALAVVREHPPARQALIVVDGRPVGYLCWQDPDPKELAAAGLAGLPAGIVDVDILIGEPDFVGRGVGPRVLRLLINRLRNDGAACVGLAAGAENPRALRAYAKAGFTLYKRFHEAGDDMCYFIHTLD